MVLYHVLSFVCVLICIYDVRRATERIVMKKDKKISVDNKTREKSQVAEATCLSLEKEKKKNEGLKLIMHS